MDSMTATRWARLWHFKLFALFWMRSLFVLCLNLHLCVFCLHFEQFKIKKIKQLYGSKNKTRLISVGKIKRSKVNDRGERPAFAHNHFMTNLHCSCSLPHVVGPDVINPPDIYDTHASVSVLACGTLNRRNRWGQAATRGRHRSFYAHWSRS